MTTPALLLDLEKLDRNIARMGARLEELGGVLRPHVKTNKSIDVTRRILDGAPTRGICVSTLKEAEYFFEHDVRDILYAVGIAPNKLDWAASLKEQGCELKIALDSLEMAHQVARHGRGRGVRHEVMIELDTDGHRSGVAPDDALLIEIADALTDGGASLLGVMTHAGESYNCRTSAELAAISRQERDRTVAAAMRLRAAGHPCPEVSVGSTPTALSVDDLSGVTEVRAGVFAFFDLVMAGVGVCSVNDIAISVLASIIGHQPAKGWAISDAGWMAMSRDRGTASQEIDYGYGLVTDPDGRKMSDLFVGAANQEHGIISGRSGRHASIEDELPVGALVRVLPNHACSTASEFDKYFVVEGDEVKAEWARINGW